MFTPLVSTPTESSPGLPSVRKVAIICSKGGLDEVYPALILASGARQSGAECTIFFTFWGLDAITESKVDHLHVNMAGNPAIPLPTVLTGLPGMENLAATLMVRKMAELDIPGPREMLQLLHGMGVKMYACELAMRMFGRTKADLIPECEDVLTVGGFYDITPGAQVIFT
jgi:peroxiredoxin family protein